MSKRKKPKPPMPDSLREIATAARSRLQARSFGNSPPLDKILPNRQAGDYLASPYADADWELWACMLLEAFGTRNFAVAHAFLRELGKLVPWQFNGEEKKHYHDGEIYQQALAIVASLRPQNEAEAAYAAQLTALHLATMRLANGFTNYTAGDSRSVAVIAKATRAYGDGLLNLKRLQGKVKPTRSRQTYKVERHVHNHQHIHVERGGAENGGQPHAKPTAGLIEASATMPGPNAEGQGVPIASGERQESVPIARREKSGSAEG